MGYVTVLMPCAACKKTVNCNPVHVPSVKVDSVKVPLCMDCATEWNRLAVERGDEAMPIHPDAYGAADENEVNWG